MSSLADKPVPLYIQAFKVLTKLSTFWASLVVFTFFTVWTLFAFGKHTSEIFMHDGIFCIVFMYCFTYWACWKKQKMEKNNESG